MHGAIGNHRSEEERYSKSRREDGKVEGLLTTHSTMKSKSLLCLFAALSTFCAATSLSATDPGLAATATNESGVDLYRTLATGDGNLCLSPYSIENALAM